MPPFTSSAITDLAAGSVSEFQVWEPPDVKLSRTTVTAAFVCAAACVWEGFCFGFAGENLDPGFAAWLPSAGVNRRDCFVVETGGQIV